MSIFFQDKQVPLRAQDVVKFVSEIHRDATAPLGKMCAVRKEPAYTALFYKVEKSCTDIKQILNEALSATPSTPSANASSDVLSDESTVSSALSNTKR